MVFSLMVRNATGFRSIVVAQFTGISLQKDDRAFVKYNDTSRAYEGITIQLSKGATSIKRIIITRSIDCLSFR